jgi:hypothetical protein
VWFLINQQEKRMENRIKQLTEERVLNVMEMNPETGKFSREAFDVRLQQAKIGILHQRESELSKRINQSQVIQVIRLVSDDSEERRQYIARSMPQLIPEKTK